MGSADAEKGADMTQQCTQWVCERGVRGYLCSADAELAQTQTSVGLQERFEGLFTLDQ